MLDGMKVAFLHLLEGSLVITDLALEATHGTFGFPKIGTMACGLAVFLLMLVGLALNSTGLTKPTLHLFHTNSLGLMLVFTAHLVILKSLFTAEGDLTNLARNLRKRIGWLGCDQ